MERLVYRINKAGSINNLRLVKENLAGPAQDEVTIQIRAIGLNFADVFCIQGLYKAAPRENLIPGLEFSGEIVDKGENVSEFNVGDKVIGITKFGAYVTHINLHKNYLIKLPASWTFEEGASFVVQALTAYYALVPLGNIKHNQFVLIHSAAGGVGIYANRIAKKFNCVTIGTVSSKLKIEKISKEGYNDILIRDKNFISNLTLSLNGNSLNLILESLTGKYFFETFKLLAPTGRAIVYGAANFATHSSFPNYFQIAYRYLKRPKIDLLQLMEMNKSVLGFNLIWLYEQNEYLRKLLEEIVVMNLEKPIIGQIYEFKDLVAAVKKFQSGRTFGKVIIRL